MLNYADILLTPLLLYGAATSYYFIWHFTTIKMGFSAVLRTKNPFRRKLPSIGFEPMTFPMSRERATPAPTGLKFCSNFPISRLRNGQAVCCFWLIFCKGKNKNLQKIYKELPKLPLFYYYYSIIGA